MSDIPAHHTAAGWADRPRKLEEFVVKSIEDHGDSVSIHQSNGWTFNRAKSDLGREIQVGETLALETVQATRITGLRDANGWLFHLSNEDLAAEARKFSEDLRRRQIENLERNRKRYAEWEDNLPDWLKARIRRFRDAAGEKFLREGWGYELVICRLADLLDRDLEAEADELAKELGASGNQWDCAKLLTRGHREVGEDFAAQVPAGLGPITGSADYR